MKLSDLDRVSELYGHLAHARSVLAGFERVPGDTVSAYAETMYQHENYGRGRRVELLPVPKSQAVSAAKREVHKIVSELAQLGVTADEGPETLRGDPPDEKPSVMSQAQANVSRLGFSAMAFVDPGATVGGPTQGH